MNLIKCGANDYQRITDFYKYVIDNSDIKSLKMNTSYGNLYKKTNGGKTIKKPWKSKVNI